MSTSGIIGTLSIYFDNGEGQQQIASLLDARLSFEKEMLPALHPDAYGWDYFVPGNSNWRAEASAIQLIDSATLVREEYLQLIEFFTLSKTLLSFVFESPFGGQYTSQGYFDSFQLGGAFNAGYAGSFSVQGVTSFDVPDTAPDTIYFLDGNNRVRQAMIDLDNIPWTPSTIFTAARSARRLMVHQEDEYIFLKEDIGNVADYIKRYDIDGANGIDLVTESWTLFDKIKDFGLNRSNRLLYVLKGFGTTERIDIYDYNGSQQDSITLTDNSSVGNMAIDGDYILYQATTNKLYQVVISTKVETQLANLTTPDNSQNSAAMDLAEGYYFYYNDTGRINRTLAPGGGGDSTIENVAVDQSGLAIDKINKLLYFGSTDRIVEVDFSGAGNRTVVDVQADTFDIRSIDMGQ